MLPINEFLPAINNALLKYACLILQAEPGAGKSTAVPLSLLNADFVKGKKIIMLEPRRIAARSIAHYLAQLLGEKVGQTVGYQIRNERKTSSATRLEIVTEGVLTRRLQADPELNDVGLIIFDEFHERSIHGDLALILCREVQDAYRNDLKLLIMSATIDSQQLSNYLANAPVITCGGRTYPVHIEYLGKSKDYLPQQILKAIKHALATEQNATNHRTDILVFLPGQNEIKNCLALAANALGQSLDCVALYGGLSLEKQQRILSPINTAKKRVIFSTNIAETSLTIDGITTVIDSGLEKTINFDIKSGLTRLDTSSISKASAVQRAGRAGRTQQGHCLRLWSESFHQGLEDFQQPEITRLDLSALVLELAAWGNTHFDKVNWLTPPPENHFVVACKLNQSLGLMDANHKMTQIGQQALSLGLEPRLASMLLQATSQKEKALACILAALLSERDIFSNSDTANIVQRLMLCCDYLSLSQHADKQALKQRYQLNISALDQVIMLAKTFSNKLGISLKSLDLQTADLADCSSQLLLYAYPDRLAKLRVSSSHSYLLANGRGVCLRNDDPLQGQPWLIVCDCDGKNKDGLIYLSCPSSLSTFYDFFHSNQKDKSPLTTETHYFLNDKKDKLLGRQKLTYGALVLEEKMINDIPHDELICCLKDIVATEGLSFLNWSEACQSWLARAQWLTSVVPQFPAISEAQLIDSLELWLLPYIDDVKSLKALKQKTIYDLLIANVSWNENQYLDQQAPEKYLTPSGKWVPIRYDQQQGPTVAVQLQEMFGELSSPKIGNNTIALRFELLSPARRPIQTTSDLANFWRTSYFEVAKEMKGRYPKHRWPAQPLLEKPGRSIKRATQK